MAKIEFSIHPRGGTRRELGSVEVDPRTIWRDEAAVNDALAQYLDDRLQDATKMERDACAEGGEKELAALQAKINSTLARYVSDGGVTRRKLGEAAAPRDMVSAAAEKALANARKSAIALAEAIAFRACGVRRTRGENGLVLVIDETAKRAELPALLEAGYINGVADHILAAEEMVAAYSNTLTIYAARARSAGDRASLAAAKAAEEALAAIAKAEKSATRAPAEGEAVAF